MMGRKRNLILIAVFLAVFVVIGVLFLIPKKSTDHTHFHAGFLVYIDGQKQDYSDGQYMYLDSCSIQAKQDNHTVEERDKVHLHNNVGNVAHIHEEGVTWKMLFKNSNITFPPHMPIVGYKNGKKVDHLLDLPITQYESVIFIIGSDEETNKSSYITKEYIQEVEGTSNYCNQ